MAGRSLHNKLKPIVLGVLASGFEPNTTADMILDFVLRVVNAGDSAPVSTGTNLVVAGGAKGNDLRRATRIIVPPLKKAIDDDKEYSVADTAAMLGFTEGSFRGFFSREGNIEVTRKKSANGAIRVTFKGRAIRECRDRRKAAEKAS